MEELEELRAQMELLKQKLDQEAIVNDHLLREVTRQKVRRLNRNVWQEAIACLFVITFGNYSFYRLHLSVAFMVATTLMMTVCFLCTLIPHRRVNMTEIMSGDLHTVAQQIRNLKLVYQRWVYIGMPIAGVWMTWFGIECFDAMDGMMIISTLVGCFIGGVTGGLIGWHQRKKLLREMDEIIYDIEH